jgi:hypothetical protein
MQMGLFMLLSRRPLFSSDGLESVKSRGFAGLPRRIQAKMHHNAKNRDSNNHRYTTPSAPPLRLILQW